MTTHVVPESILLAAAAFQGASMLSKMRLEKAKRHSTELEERIKERTSELRKLHEGQRQMLMDISHSLQTPLTVFQARLDRMKRRLAHDPEVRSFEQSLATLSAFIYDILALAQIEHGARQENQEALDASGLLNEVAEEIATIAHLRGAQVLRNIAPGVFVRGNRKQLREALMGLASNALKYLRKDGPREIAFLLAAEEGSALFCVADTGMGIAAEDIPRIFERFYRGKGPSDVRGTGLGLTIAKHIVVAHGGTIDVTSALGRGTAITIKLPQL